MTSTAASHENRANHGIIRSAHVATVAPPTFGMLRLAQILPFVGVSKPTLYSWMMQGRFPAGTKVSRSLRLIPAEDFHAWQRLGPDAWAATYPEKSQDSRLSFAIA